MRGIKRSVATLAAVGAALAATPIAGAQEVTPRFSLGGENFPEGAGFTVTIEEGTCPGGPVSITSPGFAAPVDLTTLRGRFIHDAGRYSATLKCKDTTKEGTVQYTLVQVPDSNQVDFLDKEVYGPGETIKIDGSALPRSCRPNAEVTSAGFVAPIRLQVGADNVQYGEAKAIDTPGDYWVHIHCGAVGGKNDRFTIKAAPTAPPPPGNPKPKPPIVTPKGAPDTGAGGTA